MGQKMDIMYTKVKNIANTDDTDDILKENGVQFPFQNLADLDLDAFELKIIKNQAITSRSNFENGTLQTR
jgi:hypothetical protein